MALHLLIWQDNIPLKGLGGWKGIGYAARAALLGHFNMAVHHGEGCLMADFLVLGSTQEFGEFLRRNRIA